MIYVPLAAEESQFLAGEGQEQNASFLFRLAAGPASQLNDASGAGGVVVGSGMDGSDLRGREGVLIT
jgi:hypothetical protein